MLPSLFRRSRGHILRRGLRAFATSEPPRVSLSVNEESSVATITLCNPQRRNALTVGMMEQLDDHVQTLAAWSGASTNSGKMEGAESKESNARAIILTGTKGTFCAGLDLHDNDQTCSTAAQSLRDGQNMLQHMTRVTNRLRSLPILSVAAVDGYAVGGGAELTTATDLVVLSRDAQIRFVHAQRGASPGWGGARRLVNKVGRERALRMLLLGEAVTGAEEANSGGGYADAVAEEGETALEAAMRLIEPMLELPCARSIRAMKAAVAAVDGDGEILDANSGELLDTNAGMRQEMDSFLSVWGGDSNKEQIEKARERLRGKDDADE
ncbi:hypothetical protein ACHAXT_005005 [Thalassiosira profunda]